MVTKKQIRKMKVNDLFNLLNKERNKVEILINSDVDIEDNIRRYDLILNALRYFDNWVSSSKKGNVVVKHNVIYKVLNLA